MNASLAAGARIVLVRHFDPVSALQTVRRHGVTVAYGSATMFHRLLDAAGAGAPDRLASLRYVKAGAMLVGSDLSARWADAVPEVPMVNGYGLTEASPEVTNNPPHARRAGTVGIPLPGTELRLGVPEAPDREAARGDEGEVQVRGPQVMSGYWRNADATRDAFTAEGFLRTGDLGAFDDAGYIVIRDRLKDLIKFRGWSVVPGEVEKALREHSAVAEACVVGAPDARDGEVPVAFIVLRPGADPPSGEVWRAHLDARLARFKHPLRFVSVPEIPKNHVGKPLRRVLRTRALRG
jgi:long-chain acyl-CoA synthetase